MLSDGLGSIPLSVTACLCFSFSKPYFFSLPCNSCTLYTPRAFMLFTPSLMASPPATVVYCGTRWVSEVRRMLWL